MGQLRARASASFGAHVVAVCDSSREVAEMLAREFYGCRVFERQEDLDWQALDAVFVCTPPAARGPVEIEAARHRTALFVEKPIGLSAGALEPLRQALLKSDTLTAVGYMNRYRASVQEARAKLAVGTVLCAAGYWVNGVYNVPWWSDADLSGGSLNEQATHLVDLARFLIGDIESVQASAVMYPDKPDLIGTAVINLRCESGVLCSLLYSCRASHKAVSFQAFTEAGSMRLNGWDLDLLDGTGSSPLSQPTTDRYRIFHEETDIFLKAVSTDTPSLVLCDFNDAFRTQQVMDAIALAIHSGKTEMTTGYAEVAS